MINCNFSNEIDDIILAPGSKEPLLEVLHLYHPDKHHQAEEFLLSTPKIRDKFIAKLTRVFQMNSVKIH